MPLSAFQVPVASNPAVDFLDALATNEASPNVDLKLPWRDPFAFIRAISIISVQNLAWELMLFERAANLGSTLDTDYFSAVWQFGPMVVGPPASPGYPVNDITISPDENAFYHYYIDGNMMPYRDLDQLSAPNPAAQSPLGTGVTNANVASTKLHVRLVNRSAGAKLEGASGAVKVIFYVSSVGLQA